MGCVKKLFDRLQSANMDKDKNLFWVDVETTGLNHDTDVMLEIACLVTSPELEVIAEGPDLVIHQDEEVLDGMLESVKTLHEKSGLIKRSLESKMTLDEAEDKVLKFVMEYCGFKTSPYCGNTVGFDKEMIKRHMPRVFRYMHYRTIDASTIKELARRWYPQLPMYEKKGHHRALDDIRESLEELKYYREKIFVSDRLPGI